MVSGRKETVPMIKKIPIHKLIMMKDLKTLDIYNEITGINLYWDSKLKIGITQFTMSDNMDIDFFYLSGFRGKPKICKSINAFEPILLGLELNEGRLCFADLSAI
jgi:hypothetical protein